MRMVELSWVPHTEGQQGPWGGQAEQGEALLAATGRLHTFTRAGDATQGMNTGTLPVLC